MKKKILVSILIFLIVFVYASNVFALVINKDDGSTIILTDVEKYQYTYIFDYNNNWYCMQTSTIKPTFVKVNDNGSISCRYKSDSSFSYKQIYFSKKDGSVAWGPHNFDHSDGGSVGFSIPVSTNDVFYVNFNISGPDFSYGPIGTAIDDTFDLYLSLSTTEKTTNVPIVITSQAFTEEGILKYNLEYSFDNENFESASRRSITSISDGNTFYQFYYNAYDNRTYYFRLKNNETGEYIYKNIIVDNIIFTQDNVNNYVDGVFDPHPFLSYEYVSDTEINITTQKFFEDEILKVECSYAKDITNDDLQNESVWTSVSIRSLNDIATNTATYQFYLNVKNDDGTGDGSYYFRFYNKELDKYTYATIEVTFQDIIEYHASTSEINQQFNRFVSFFKDKFGFLAYPFELIVDILDRIGSIKFEEPVINIPDIYEPVTDVKIISATQLNFNDILEEDEVFKNIHDIYLIIVDVILCFGIAMFAKNKIMKVLSK